MLNLKNEKDKEIKELKDKINKLEIFCIDKDKYFQYFPDKNKLDKEITLMGYSLIFECNENDVTNLVNTFNKMKDEIKELIYLNSLEEIYIIPNKNEINILLVRLLDKNDKEDKKKDFLFSEIINQPIAYLPFAGSGLKIILKTDATLIDLFELKDNDSLDNIILNTTFNIEGLTLKSQIFVSLLVLLLKSLNPDDKIRAKIFNLVNDIVLTIINGNTSYKIMNKEMFDDYEKASTSIRHLAP